MLSLSFTLNDKPLVNLTNSEHLKVKDPVSKKISKMNITAPKLIYFFKKFLLHTGGQGPREALQGGGPPHGAHHLPPRPARGEHLHPPLLSRKSYRKLPTRC